MIEHPPSDVLRIMCATDNHLGYPGITDPIRGMDSFNTMDEILQIARDYHCDMVVLGGDLFHDNKPSRRTMFQAQKLFKKHVFGDGPVNIKVVSDQALNFDGRIVNYEDPNLAVQLPVFAIHGNHDDPTREGTQDSLSALDLLAEAGLVGFFFPPPFAAVVAQKKVSAKINFLSQINYFGRIQTVGSVKIRPVLIEKGPVKLGLYGLGWVRDERFCYSPVHAENID